MAEQSFFARIQTTLEHLIQVLIAVGVLKEIKDERGNRTGFQPNPTIKSGAKMFGLGKAEEAIFQALVSQLRKADGTPSLRKQQILKDWFPTLKRWQKIELMMTFAKLVDQFGKQHDPLRVPLDTLSMLAEIGGEATDHQKRTAYCIATGIFGEKPPWWYRVGETIQSILGKNWVKEIVEYFKKVDFNKLFKDSIDLAQSAVKKGDEIGGDIINSTAETVDDITKVLKKHFTVIEPLPRRKLSLKERLVRIFLF